MHFLCWACCERYDDDLGGCPQCGASKIKPVKEPAGGGIGGTEKKETLKKGKAGKG